MKRNGFTLAEVLITLGIIGVVAALTMPTFTAKTQSAKIGPTLAKASSVFSQAAKSVMSRAQSDTISGAVACVTGGDSTTCDKDYLTQDSFKVLVYNLNDFINGTISDDARIDKLDDPDEYSACELALIAADGVRYEFFSGGAHNSGTNIPSQDSIGVVAIDINGAKEPNIVSKDQFYFILMDDGSLVPYGVTSKKENYPNEGSYEHQWKDECKIDAVPTKPASCTAHIFENGLKAEYK